MVAFLNKHMSFYANYMGMVAHFAEVFVKQYFLCENVRPMAWTAAAVFFTSFKYLVEAIVAEDDDDERRRARAAVVAQAEAFVPEQQDGAAGSDPEEPTRLTCI